MKKTYTLFILMILTAFAVNGQSKNFGGGAGTSANPYQVATAEHLNNIRDILTENVQYHFIQVADIDLSGYPNWEPIGGNGSAVVFNGYYNGQHFTISNLTINRPSADNVGLFGHVASGDQPNFGQSSRVRNIVLRNVQVTGNTGVGALAGRQTGSERNIIEGCYVVNGSVTGNSGVGGLVGINASFSPDPNNLDGFRPIVRRSFTNVTVNATGIDVGGAIGRHDKGIVENLYALGQVNASSASHVGGLVGLLTNNSILRNSYAAGGVAGNGATIGGLIGANNETEGANSITASYWDTDASGQATSDGGSGRTTAQMQTQSNYSGWNFAGTWNILENEYYPFLREKNLSGFDISDPGEQTAGQSFSIAISNAVNVGGFLLEGVYNVEISTDIVSEGSNGFIGQFQVAFTNGVAQLPEITLFRAGLQNLQLNISTILLDEVLPLQVRSGQAIRLVVLQQPTQVFGNNNDQPATIDPIVVAAVDEWDNISGEGLNGVQEVIVSIAVDGSAQQDATLGNVQVLDIQEGQVTFEGLTLDREGMGYVLRFTSEGPDKNTNLGWVDTQPFDVLAIDDLSGFVVTQPLDGELRLVQEPFAMSIEEAKAITGASLQGSVNVQVTSSLEGLIFNQDVSFSAGNASIAIILETIGLHDLTVSIEGVTHTVVVNQINAVNDFSGFTLSLNPAEGPFYVKIPFILEVSNALDFNDNYISTARVTVTSNLDQVVFDQEEVNFLPGVGDVDLELVLFTPGEHTLTVTVEGVTEPRTIHLIVEPNLSGFDLALVNPGVPVTAGEAVALSITNARNVVTPSVDFNGNYLVTVMSDLEGQVSQQQRTFNQGAVNFGVPLTLAGIHELTVEVATIDTEETVQDVVVEASAVVSLVIVSGDVEDVFGNNDGFPAKVGNITLQTIDEFGNLSTLGLEDTQEINATLLPLNGAIGEFTEESSTKGDISSGTFTFDNLFITDEGEYQIVFATEIDFEESVAITNVFEVFNIDNQAGFEIVDPGPQVVGQLFEVTFINAKHPDGSFFNGSFSVFILDTQIFTPLFSGTANFVEGSATVVTTQGYTSTGIIPTLFRLDNNLGTQITQGILVVASDQSDFALVDPGSQTAGVPFDLQITNALNKAGNPLNAKEHRVIVATDLPQEGDNGLLFDDFILFSSGTASISGLVLTVAEEQNLTVSIDWVTDSRQQGVTVNSNTATRFVFVQQPIGFASGEFLGTPQPVGNVVVQTLDDYDNLSMVGMADDFSITAAIHTGPAEAELTGQLTLNLEDAEATFPDLMLDKNGTYTLSFTFNGTADAAFAPNPLISDPFQMVDIEDLSGLVILDPGKQYVDLPFVLQVQNARDQFGQLLNGSFLVVLESDQVDEGNEGEIYSQAFLFTEGALELTLTLSIAETHLLTLTLPELAGDNNQASVEVLVAPDLSAFTLNHTPPVYQNNPFDLFIIDATDLDGDLLSGSFTVSVTSNIPEDEEIFQGTVAFSNGNAILNLILTEVAEYTLTVEVQGITNTEILEVDVLGNVSGFDIALTVAGDKIAGEAFSLDITNAIGLDGLLLGQDETTAYWVSIASDLLVDPVFDAQVDFSAGEAQFDITLTLAQLHNLSVLVTTITQPGQLDVNVIPAQVAQLELVVENPPLGGIGTGDDTPTAIGSLIIRTLDAFGNPSDNSLEGTQTITAALTVDGSFAGNAQLEGNLSQSILGGQAAFDDLTLNKDGQGYVVTFSYSGTPDLELASVATDPFDMEEVNLYQIVVQDADENILDNDNPLVFETETAGYTSLEEQILTVTKTAGGDINNLVASLNEESEDFFVLGALSSSTLTDMMDQASFTLRPADDLAPGNYQGTITLTGDPGIAYSFDVLFSVLAPYAITLTDDLDQPLGPGLPLVFETVDEAYIPEIRTVTIANTGAETLTGMEVIISGDPSAFVVGALSQTSLTAGQTASFTLSPQEDLSPGVYEETVTVRDEEENVEVSFLVQFTVEAFTYAIVITPADDPLVLPTRPEGYDPSGAARTLTITSTGTGPINNLSVTLIGGPGSDFQIVDWEPRPLTFNGDQVTFTIEPVAGLAKGEYFDFIIVDADNISEQDKAVEFEVVTESIWTGAVSASWGVAGNWQNNVVPDGQSPVRIPAGLSRYPVISELRTVKDLVMEQGTTLAINAGGRLTINNNGSFLMRTDSEVTAPGDIRVQSGAVMTLEPGARLTSTGSFVNNAGVNGLILQSNAQNTASFIHNSAGVQATVHRYMSGGKTHVMAPPVSGMGIQSFLAANPDIFYHAPTQQYAIRHYDPASGWAPFYTPATAGNLLGGRAYSIYINNNGFVVFRGTLRQSEFVVNIPFNEGAFGWNGLGNPYASSIGARSAASTVQDFLSVNQSQLALGYEAIYLYDPDLPAGFRYHIINNTQTVNDKNYISSGQGFIVKAKDLNSKITFTQPMRTHQTDDFYKENQMSEQWYGFRMIALSGSRRAQTFVNFNERMTEGFDATYDAAMFVEDSNFQLFTSMVDGSMDLRLGIQALPTEGYNTMVIPVGFLHPAGGSVTLSLAETQLPSYLYPMLEDTQTGAWVSLRESSYTINVAAAKDPKPTGRFFIHMIDTRQFYTVNYGADSEMGSVQAFAGQSTIESGSNLPEGTMVAFEAIAENNHAFDHWMVNGKVHKNNGEGVLTVSALEDHLSVWAVFTSTLSDDAHLADLLVNGVSLENFEPHRTFYHLNLPENTTVIPVVDAMASHPAALVEVHQAVDLTGDDSYRTAYVQVTAENGKNIRYYKVLFTLGEERYYPVYFMAEDTRGDIQAWSDGQPIENGQWLAHGSSIHLRAKAVPGYTLMHWSLNQQIDTHNTGEEFFVEELTGELQISVRFTETTSQIDENLAGDNLIFYTFENRIVIDGFVGENTQMMLWDMLGRVVRTEVLNAGYFNTFSIQGLHKGVYIISLQGPETNAVHKLLID